MSTDLEDMFTGVGRTAPASTVDLDHVITRARRVRARRKVRRGATGVVTVMAVAGAAALVFGATKPSAPAQPGGPGSGPVVTTSPTVKVPRVATGKQLQDLALAVAAPAGGKATASPVQDVSNVGKLIDRSSLVHVNLGAKGSFDVLISVDLDPHNSVAVWTTSCHLDNGGAASGKACQPLYSTPREFVFSENVTSQKGRKTLSLAATTAAHNTLYIRVDNYTEQDNGTKVVGPTWQQVGITAASLRAAVQSSGLLR